MRQPLGQHFLRDVSVVRTIVAAAELSPDETALEIGPGKGVLTEALIGRVAKLIVVELDRNLAERLIRVYKDRPLQVVQGDFLKQDLNALAPPGKPVKILGNLPYAITAPIFEKILAWPNWQTGVFLVQKEVADRMRSAEGSRTYGILSLAVQLYASVESILSVPPGAFQPPPAVTSSVIRLRRKTAPALAAALQPAFFDLVRGAFAHRRKTLVNSLALHASIDKKAVESWLQKEAVSAGGRAETVSLSEYVRLTASWAVFRRESGI